MKEVKRNEQNLSQENNKKLSYNDYMELGKESFSKRNYPLALEYYTLAIEIKCDDSRAYLNRSAVNLQLNCYYQAYNDAEKSLKISSGEGKPNEKSFYRMGKAAYLMRQFQLSTENFKKCLEINLSNSEAAVELKRSEKRLEESRTGVYDQNYMIENLKVGVQEMDVADYTSNKIKVVVFRKGYKGVKTIEAIKKGTLLVVSKAVSIVYNKDEKNIDLSRTSVTNPLEFLTEIATANNFSNLVKKMKNDPELAKQIYDLKCDNRFDQENPPNQFIIDTARIESIHNLNRFYSENLCPEKYSEIRDERMRHQMSKKDELEDDDEPNYSNLNYNCGIWLFPSYFNHSCVANCQRVFFGDVMLIYASKDIDMGEELYFRYFPSDLFYKKRSDIANKIYDFNCECEICMYDAQDENIDARQKLFDFHINHTRYDITHDMQNLLSDASQYKEVLQSVLATVDKYRDHCKINPCYKGHFSISLQNLLILYKYNENWLEAAKISEDIFHQNKDDCLKVALISLADSYYLYNLCSEKDEAVRVYRIGATMFFDNCEPFYKYVFSKAYKEIKSLMLDIQELISLSK